MKKYSGREKTLIRLAVLVVAFAVGQSQFDRYKAAKAQIQRDIVAEGDAQGLYQEKLNVDIDRLLGEIERFDVILEESQDRILYMQSETEAIFKVQETLSQLGETAEINMNSQNKRKSKSLSDDTDLIELRTYFGFDCELLNLLEFFDAVKQVPHYLAVDTLNINSYSHRRRRRLKDKDQRAQDKIRGSVVMSTLFVQGTPEEAAQRRIEGVLANEPKPEEPAPSTLTTFAEVTASDQDPNKVNFKPTDAESLPNIGETVKELTPLDSVTRSLPDKPRPLTHTARPDEKKTSPRKSRSSNKF